MRERRSISYFTRRSDSRRRTYSGASIRPSSSESGRLRPRTPAAASAASGRTVATAANAFPSRVRHATNASLRSAAETDATRSAARPCASNTLRKTSAYRRQSARLAPHGCERERGREVEREEKRSGRPGPAPREDEPQERDEEDEESRAERPLVERALLRLEQRVRERRAGRPDSVAGRERRGREREERDPERRRAGPEARRGSRRRRAARAAGRRRSRGSS